MGPMQKSSVAVTNPSTNRPSPSSFVKRRFSHSPRDSRRSSMRSSSPTIAPRTMPTSGNTRLWVSIASLTPITRVAIPMTWTTVVRTDSGMRWPMK